MKNDIDFQKTHIDEEIAIFESLICNEYESINRIKDRIKRYELSLDALRLYKRVALSNVVRGSADV